MSRVFISYRRADSAQWANNLYNHLWVRYGKDLVFQDVDISPGTDFLKRIRQELESSKAFLIVIGPCWLSDGRGSNRLNDPKDVLRMEIAKALSSQGAVIPVLVGGASMPSSDDLPKPLKPLSRRQAISLTDEKWVSDVEALLERLREIILPTATEITQRRAEQELYAMQLRYFDLLENKRAAEALDLAQKTQAYLDRVMPLYPQNPVLKETRGYLYKNEAMSLNYLERYGEADKALDKGEVIFRTMIDERPQDAGAWNGLGSIEAVRGNYEKAHEYVDRALKILPDYPAAIQDHEQILARLGTKTCDVMKSLGERRRSDPA